MSRKNFRTHGNKLGRTFIDGMEPTTVIVDEVVDDTVQETIESDVELDSVVNSESNKEVDVVVVNCNMLNVRENPVKDAPVLHTILLGTKMTVKITNTDWSQVLSIAGLSKHGYVMRKFIKEV